MRNRSLVFKSSVFLGIMIVLLSSVLVTISIVREKNMYYDYLRQLEAALHAQLELGVDTLEAAKGSMNLKPDQFMANQSNIRLAEQLEAMTKDDLITNSYVMTPDITAKDGKSYLKMMLTNKSLDAQGLGPLKDYELPATFQAAYEEAQKSGVGMTEEYEDMGGTWISLLSTIKNEKGQTVAIFGLDFDYGKVKAELDKTTTDFVLISIGAEVFFILLVIVMLRYTLRPLRRLSELSLKASEGDLSISIPVHNRDEVGKLSANFNTMIGSIRSLVQNIKNTADDVMESSDNLRMSADQTAKATNEVAASIQEVASGSESQLQSAEESRKAMGEMAVGIERIADSSSVVSELAQDASRDADNGNEVIQQTVEQMNKIEVSVTKTASIMHELNERSVEIGHIVDIISDIANQTNLLALNASIEAARAGEHGKGFAVVAHEVRKLAEKSKESSDQIAQLLHGIGINMNSAVQAMEAGSKEVKTGTDIAGQAGEAFQKIVVSFQHVTEQVQEVSAAAEQMSAGSEEIAASLEELSRIAKGASVNSQSVAASSEEQLAAMEEIAASATSLREMAATLQKEINKFKL
ncbi:methyl-accepting chemotaxis protein [Paenibacillus sp. MBLB4367]|uniref:methyl-accepting chemotaxis protein n=1 Tax=Paenibacillus sp. MBLB4367 TaxID=3384767 RepID=UPI00390809DE